MTKQESRQDSPYLRLLDRIELADVTNPLDISIVKANLVRRAVFRLYEKGNPIGQAWCKLWGGGEFQSDAALVAAVNGWRDLPAFRYRDPNWYELASPGYCGDVDAVAEEVACIQKEDEAARIAEKTKASERSAARKETRLLKERGYVLMYVHPEDIEKVNGLLQHGIKFDVLDSNRQKVLVLHNQAKEPE